MLHSKHIYVIGYPFLSDSYKTKKTSVNIHDFIEKKYMIQKMIKHMQALIWHNKYLI